MTGRYRLQGLGSDLRLDLAGPDQAACLAAAVRGFAEAVAGAAPPDDLARQHAPLALDEDSAAALLLALVDELVLRLDADGLLACDLEVVDAREGTLRGRLALVELSALEPDGVAPKAATWHGLRLDPAAGGWEGTIVLDL